MRIDFHHIERLLSGRCVDAGELIYLGVVSDALQEAVCNSRCESTCRGNSVEGARLCIDTQEGSRAVEDTDDFSGIVDLLRLKAYSFSD